MSSLSLTDFVALTEITAAGHNANNAALEAWANGNIGADNIAAGELTDSEFSSSAGMYAAYRTIHQVTIPVHTGDSASTVILANSAGTSVAHGAGIVASGTVSAAVLLRLEAADYTISGRTTKLRVRAQLVTDAVAPAITFTAGLHPVSTPSAGAWQFGSAESGSTAAIASPSANSLNEGDSGDFSIPADGYYGLGVVKSATGTASFDAVLNIQLQQRWT